MDRQLRVTDLVPRKYLTLLLWFLSGMTVIVGLEALYAWMPELAGRTTDGRIAALDLDSEGSLGAWYSSFILQLAAAMALVVFVVRRQKADDYHGRYRIWAWAALCWQVMSIDESASVHEGFKELMTLTTGQRVLGDGSIWWVAAYALILGTLGVRLVLEMRACRGSTASLFLSGLCFVAAIVAQMGGVWPDQGARAVMLEEGFEMAGGVLLLLAMTLHARYVILAAQGSSLAGATKSKRQRKKSADAATPSAGAESHSEIGGKRSDLEPHKPAKPGLLVAAASGKVQPHGKPQATITANRIDPAQTAVRPPKLSKAERRALRKQQRDQYEEA